MVLKRLYEGLCDLLYPHHCLLCKKYLNRKNKADILCSSCEAAIVFNRPPFRRWTDVPFDRVWSAVFYREPIRHLLHLFKYGEKTAVRHLFGRLLHNFLERYSVSLEHFELIVPIPLHPLRLAQRGYNQAELLARIIAARHRRPVVTGNLIRTRYTAYQAKNDPKERWTNIRGAFRIKHPESFLNKSVLLVDDLLTTGATVYEASTVLKQAGAKKIGVLTLAITEE